MRKTIVTCDICGSKHTNSHYRIELSFYDRVQCEGFVVPSEKYRDLCGGCFDKLRKAIELEMEKLRND